MNRTHFSTLATCYRRFVYNDRFALFVAASMAIGKAGLYGAATHELGRNLKSLGAFSTIDDDNWSLYCWDASLVVSVGFFLRTLAVYGPKIFQALRQLKPTPIRSPQAHYSLFTHCLVQGTSIASGVSGYVGLTYCLASCCAEQAHAPLNIALSSLMGVSNYIGEYALGGDALKKALSNPNCLEHFSSARDAWRALYNSTMNRYTLASKIIFLLFQSLDEAAAIIFLFYRLAHSYCHTVFSIAMVAGAYGSISTFIRTLLLYGPRMGLSQEHRNRPSTGKTWSRSFLPAALISSISALGKCFASADGYYDSSIMLHGLNPIEALSIPEKIAICTLLTLLLASALIAEPYLSFADTQMGLKSCYNSLFKKNKGNGAAEGQALLNNQGI